MLSAIRFSGVYRISAQSVRDENNAREAILTAAAKQKVTLELDPPGPREGRFTSAIASSHPYGFEVYTGDDIEAARKARSRQAAFTTLAQWYIQPEQQVAPVAKDERQALFDEKTTIEAELTGMLEGFSDHVPDREKDFPIFEAKMQRIAEINDRLSGKSSVPARRMPYTNAVPPLPQPQQYVLAENVPKLVRRGKLDLLSGEVKS